jgi:hypothetical protein
MPRAGAVMDTRPSGGRWTDVSAALGQVSPSVAKSHRLQRRLLEEQLQAASLRTSDLADVWLVKAVSHLLTACDVPDPVAAELMAGARPPVDHASSEPPSVATLVRRLDESRTSILFAATAAEAYLDRYVLVCGPGYRSLLDRLPASDRFALAAAVFSGPDALRPAGSLQQAIAELLSLRDDLARARPLEAGPAESLREMFGRFNPGVARRMSRSPRAPARPSPSVAARARRARPPSPSTRPSSSPSGRT